MGLKKRAARYGKKKKKKKEGERGLRPRRNFFKGPAKVLPLIQPGVGLQP